MSLPPLESPVTHQPLISGDVRLAGDALVGSGVMLLAEVGARLIVESGVCLGMGTILRARGGRLVIRQGAILAAGVLVVGQGEVGSGASIGTSTTLLDPAIATAASIAPGSLVDQRPTPSAGSVVEPPAASSESVRETPTSGPSAAPLAPPMKVYGKEQFLRMRQAMFSRGAADGASPTSGG